MNILEARGVTKTYRIGVGRARVREMLPGGIARLFGRAFPRWWERGTFKALDSVSIGVRAGTALGIVGHNGAGKTTLLKLIAGVTASTAGDVVVRGRMGALIDVVVGFHPELTGRENVYLLGAMYGLGRRAMAARMGEILAFAEIDELADTPLKRYSSGMAARLGFGTITALDLEILLVDVVLAVGDANFQRKCMRWIDQFRSSGGTLLFVSHNLGLLRNMTERALWLDHGRVRDEGPTADLLPRYAQAMEQRDAEGDRTHARVIERGLHRWGAGGARVREVHFEETSLNRSLLVDILYEDVTLERASFYVGFLDDGGREIGSSVSPPMPLSGAGGSIGCEIRPLPLRDGVYFPVVGILSADGVVRDRWRLDRAVVVERSTEPGDADVLGPLEIQAEWVLGRARRLRTI